MTVTCVCVFNCTMNTLRKPIRQLHIYTKWEEKYGKNNVERSEALKAINSARSTFIQHMTYLCSYFCIIVWHHEYAVNACTKILWDFYKSWKNEIIKTVWPVCRVAKTHPYWKGLQCVHVSKVKVDTTMFFSYYWGKH